MHRLATIAALVWSLACSLLMPTMTLAQASTPQQCQALAMTDFGQVLDAPTKITAAKVVTASGSVPEYCRVEGYVAPQVGIEFHLPLANWNGKFVLVGCGGMCGVLQGVESCPEAIARGYACGTTDMGHKGTPTDGRWAYANPTAEIDVGHRGTHVAAIAGKAITNAFYKADIKRSYFRGCSTGGRQGLVEAQRYPYDFDGIIAGAPVLYTPMGPPLQMLWNSTANIDSNGKLVLTDAKLSMLHKAVMNACDAIDGLKDGMIADPRACKFDAKKVACGAGGGDQCLTEAELSVVDKFYGGPRSSKGPIPRIGGQPFGSEPGWLGYLPGRTSPLYSFAVENLRYLGFALDPGPTYDGTGFDWDRDPQRLSYSHLSAGNPDLSLFAENGGKLLLFHGWGDPAIPATSTIDYYDRVTRTMGGLAETQKFARLFLLPGLGHCVGGGVNFADVLGTLDSWVENGQAPEQLTGYGFPGSVGPNVAPAGFVGNNIDALKPTFSRPVFPYPDQVKYQSGEASSAASFKRVRVK